MGNNDLAVSLHTVNDKVKFTADSRNNPAITVDYFPPLGNGEGYTSLELLMISFASCIGSTLLAILRAIMHKNVDSLQISAKGAVREEHPRVFSHIQLDLFFKSEDAGEADVKKALVIAEEKLCPVWNMLKGNVEISVSYVISK